MIDILSTSPNEYLFLPKESQWIVQSNDHESDVTTIQKLFDPRWLLAEDLVSRTASGRGLVYFFSAFNENCVLRHYYRGGLIAKLSKDSFVLQNLKKTRPFEELNLLSLLYNAGLNVPKPLAARVIRANVSYTADIITGEIPSTKELHEQLLSQTLEKQTWLEIGATLRKMHNLQACHYDINVKNVLLQQLSQTNNNADSKQQVSVYLLDFDGCKLRQGEGWKKANLDRFKRSLEKQKSKCAPYYYDETNWQWIEEGYCVP